MKKFVLLGATLLAGASLAQAATITLDTTASSVGWKGSKKMGTTHHGYISIKQGVLELDKKNQLTGGSIVIDMKTITDEDLKDSPEYQKKLVGHLSSADFFNVEKFPESTFKITKVSQKSKGEVVLKGDLTMIGKTSPFEFPATVKFDQGIFSGDATIKLDRTQWGLKYGSGSFFKELTADKIINNEIELAVKLVSKK